MRSFAEAWPEADFVQQPVGQLPWGHNLVLLAKLEDRGSTRSVDQELDERGTYGPSCVRGEQSGLDGSRCALVNTGSASGTVAR